MTRTCEFPAVEPSRGNPAGDCRAEPVAAVRRGNGSTMLLCPVHARRYTPDVLLLLDDLEEDR